MQKTPATKTATRAVGTYKIRLEAVRELGSELGFGFLQPGSEGGALDADDLGDFLVSQFFLTELSDLYRFRHQFIQPIKELVQLGLVSDDLFDGRCRVLQHVEQGDLVAVVVAGGHVQRKDVAGSMELAVIAHTVAKPPLISGAHAAVMILLPLPKVGPPVVEFLVLLRCDLEPLLGLLVVDALGFTLVYTVLHRNNAT